MKPGWRRLLQVNNSPSSHIGLGLKMWRAGTRHEARLTAGIGLQVGLAASHLPNLGSQRLDRTSEPVMASHGRWPGCARRACTWPAMSAFGEGEAEGPHRARVDVGQGSN